MKIGLEKTAEENIFLLVNVSKNTVDLLVVSPMEDTGIYRAKIAMCNNAEGTLFMTQEELDEFIHRLTSLNNCKVYAV